MSTLKTFTVVGQRTERLVATVEAETIDDAWALACAMHDNPSAVTGYLEWDSVDCDTAEITDVMEED